MRKWIDPVAILFMAGLVAFVLGCPAQRNAPTGQSQRAAQRASQPSVQSTLEPQIGSSPAVFNEQPRTKA